MRLLTFLIALAALLWSGWWFVGRAGVERATAAGIAAARDAGWRIELEDLSVTGFPNRFDSRLTAPRVTTPDGDWGVAASFAEVFALSYRPNRIIAAVASPVSLTTPAGPAVATFGDLRASATASPSGQPDLRRATAVASGLTVAGDGWDAALTSGQVALRAAAGVPDTYDLSLDLADLSLTGTDMRLPMALDSVAVDGTVTLDAPAAQGGKAASVTLRRAEAVWGDVRVDLTGTVDIGRNGLPEGTLTLTVDGWRGLLPLAAAGLPAGQVALLAGGLSGLDDGAGRVAVPLTLRGGQVSFGSIPLATLPRR